MTADSLAGVEACVFDAYGTLFDLGSAARGCADALGPRAPTLTGLWREKQLQYTWLLAAQGRHADFEKVTADALDFALETLGIDGAGLRQRLMSLYRTPDAFPEAPAALRRLKAGGRRLAILSNGTPAMLEAAVAGAGLVDLFEAIVSVEEVGVYKPHPAVYRRALERLDLPARAVVFVSSNAWDAHAASAFGMQVVWCNRTGQPRERLPGAPDREIVSLAQLAALVVGAP
ncbi:MAG: haloacid dehalogenase type II [Roseiarcus sp.]